MTVRSGYTHAIGAELQTVELELSQFIGVLIIILRQCCCTQPKFNVSLFVVFFAMHACIYMFVYILLLLVSIGVQLYNYKFLY